MKIRRSHILFAVLLGVFVAITVECLWAFDGYFAVTRVTDPSHYYPYWLADHIAFLKIKVVLLIGAIFIVIPWLFILGYRHASHHDTHDVDNMPKR